MLLSAITLEESAFENMKAGTKIISLNMEAAKVWL
jgi:hypothetical protein